MKRYVLAIFLYLHNIFHQESINRLLTSAQNVAHSLNVSVKTCIMEQSKARCRIQRFVKFANEILLISKDRRKERPLLNSIKKVDFLVFDMLYWHAVQLRRTTWPICLWSLVWWCRRLRPEVIVVVSNQSIQNELITSFMNKLWFLLLIRRLDDRHLNRRYIIIKLINLLAFFVQLALHL